MINHRLVATFGTKKEAESYIKKQKRLLPPHRKPSDIKLKRVKRGSKVLYQVWLRMFG